MKKSPTEKVAAKANRLLNRLEEEGASPDLLGEIRDVRDKLTEVSFAEHGEADQNGEDWLQASSQYDDLFGRLAKAIEPKQRRPQ